jgi:HPt (histidine-containing phosphotransfer) domain-containing protein
VSPQAQVLNAVQGLQLWAGQEQAYLRALRAFAADNASAAAELALAAASGRHAAGRLRAHQIRGAAANLGLEQLAAALGRLESALASEDSAALPALLDLASHCLADALAAARAASADTPAAAAAASAAAARPDSELLRTLGVKLKRSIDSGSFDQEAMTELTQVLHGSAAPAVLAELQRAIDDFDFATAQARLETLLAGYLPPSGGAS